MNQELANRIYVIVSRTTLIGRSKWKGTISESQSQDPYVRFCMTSGRIASHAMHASLKMAALHNVGATGIEPWDCDILLLSVANNEELVSDVACKLVQNEIPFAKYWDTDRLWDGEVLTALCTFPITKTKAACLQYLKPWRCACNS